MPTLITHANPSGPLCRQACSRLQLPQLSALLRLLTPGARTVDPQDTLTPLHELLKARALGLNPSDGLTPWAALQALRLQLQQPGTDWAWLTPCHWQVNADHVRMAAPGDTQISDGESEALMDAMRPYLAEDGITLHGLHQGNWLASGPVFRALPTASLARASGGAVDHWMPRAPQAGTLRRLQNEMQMLLYTHPINDARAARKLLAINSFWVSGTGSLPDTWEPTSMAPSGTDIYEALQEPGARDDGAAWLAAWRHIDTEALTPLVDKARKGEPVELVLCGEQAAQTFSLQARGLWSRLRTSFDIPDLAALLQSL